MTPELEKELKALRLRANFDPKRRGEVFEEVDEKLSGP